MRKYLHSFAEFVRIAGWSFFVWVAAMLTGMTGFVLQAVFHLDPQKWSLSLWLPASFIIVIVVTFIAFHRMFWKHEEFKAQYSDPDLLFSSTKVDHVMSQAVSAARLALRHNGNRSVRDLRARIIGMASLSKDPVVDSQCGDQLPIWLNPINFNPGPFELHSQSTPEWLEVAHRSRFGNVMFLSSVDPSNPRSEPIMIPSGDYLMVIQATGHNAHEAIAAYVLRDIEEPIAPSMNETEHKLTFERLTAPIADLLGADHRLAKDFDNKLTPIPRSTSV